MTDCVNLNRDMLLAILAVTNIKEERTIAAIEKVLLAGGVMASTASEFGMSKQHLHAKVARVLELKPLFDAYFVASEKFLRIKSG